MSMLELLAIAFNYVDESLHIDGEATLAMGAEQPSHKIIKHTCTICVWFSLYVCVCVSRACKAACLMFCLLVAKAKIA